MACPEGNTIMRTVAAAALMALAGITGGCQDQNTPAQATNAAGAAEGETPTAALAAAPDLSISARLIGSSQLGTALDGNGSYTVFAPIDAAWSKLDAAELLALEAAEGRPQLIAVLRQHIAPGYILGADLDQALARKDGSTSLATMGASPIMLHRDAKSIVLGEGEGAPRIIGEPIVAGNDVIYRIDSLIPPPD